MNEPRASRSCFGPGRVNLMGDHTDYNQGLALPMAVDLGVAVTFDPWDEARIDISSDAYPGEPASFPLDPDVESIQDLEPAWARLAAAVVSLARPELGGRFHIASSLPRGSGLSSSAAVAVALAELCGVEGDALVVARLCQAAEHRIGVPVGLLDPLVCAGGRAGQALRIDFATLTTEPVTMAVDVECMVVDSGQRRDLRTSAYATRVAECGAAAAVVGPLGLATEADIIGLRDPLLRRRARHVVSECARVDAFARALSRGDLVGAGGVMDESHRSLAEDFEATTPVIDELTERVRSRPGVVGARMTGAGFGGCIVALAEPGTVDPASLDAPAWRVVPVDGTVARRKRG